MSHCGIEPQSDPCQGSILTIILVGLHFSTFIHNIKSIQNYNLTIYDEMFFLIENLFNCLLSQKILSNSFSHIALIFLINMYIEPIG